MSFVTACNSEFRLKGERFGVTGFNCYFLAYCSDTSRRAALMTAKQMGATVVRCWAFLAVDPFLSGQVAFQYFKDGGVVINDGPDGLHRLDALIQAAEDLDLKLILPLVNYWDDLGGMNTYVKWFCPGADITEFYRNAVIRAAYQEWVFTVLNRRNTCTGRLYSQEPSVMAWELTNEARCPVPDGRELLFDWVTQMAAFVKRQDSSHLLALGDEGFFFEQGRGHLYDGTYGVDWLTNLAVEGIDFATFHLYPQSWGRSRNPDFAFRWIEEHIQAATRVNKPVILEEFGLKLDNCFVKTPEDRASWYPQWIDAVQRNHGAGQLLWMLGYSDAEDTREYKDDYVIYPNH